jgi:hypothetical protein
MRRFPLISITKRNLLNLVIVFAMLTLVAGCVFNTGKEIDKKNPDLSANNGQLAAAPANRPVRNPDGGDFIVRLAENVEPQFAGLDLRIKSEKLLEKAADDLNRAIGLPADIFIRTAACGQANAEYDPETRLITVCYELFTHFAGLFESDGLKPEAAEKKAFEAVRFAFLHEVGHALIENFRLPVAGGEEDAADRCAAYINIVELRRPGLAAVIAAADAFRIEAKQRPSTRSDAASEHSLNQQRAYDSFCMIYGSEPAKYQNFIAEGYLPADRAEKCQAEFLKMAASWENLLRPWRKGD